MVRLYRDPHGENIFSNTTGLTAASIDNYVESDKESKLKARIKELENVLKKGKVRAVMNLHKE